MCSATRTDSGHSYEEYRVAGIKTSETIVMMEETAASGGFAAAQAVHGGITPPFR
jgi:hypothetical protein